MFMFCKLYFNRFELQVIAKERKCQTIFCSKYSNECQITRSSWFNCALRDDEAVCWVSIGHYEALAVGN